MRHIQVMRRRWKHQNRTIYQYAPDRFVLIHNVISVDVGNLGRLLNDRRWRLWSSRNIHTIVILLVRNSVYRLIIERDWSIPPSSSPLRSKPPLPLFQVSHYLARQNLIPPGLQLDIMSWLSFESVITSSKIMRATPETSSCFQHSRRSTKIVSLYYCKPWLWLVVPWGRPKRCATKFCLDVSA